MSRYLWGRQKAHLFLGSNSLAKCNHLDLGERCIAFLPQRKEDLTFGPALCPTLVKPSAEGFYVTILTYLVIGIKTALKICCLLLRVNPCLPHDELVMIETVYRSSEVGQDRKGSKMPAGQRCEENGTKCGRTFIPPHLLSLPQNRN